MEAEHPGVNSYWHAALTSEQTKTKEPYIWVLPSQTDADSRLGRAIGAARTQRKKEIGKGLDPAANPGFKKEAGRLQTRLDQVLKRLKVPPPKDKKNWPLKALRQNAAMEAAQEAPSSRAAPRTAAGRKLQHRPGSRATDKYLLERPACLQGLSRSQPQ